MFHFTTCAFVLSPLTYVWLEGLESRFPGSSEDTSVTQSTAEKHGSKQGKQKLNVKNIVAKVVIDQTIGGAINTVVFVMTMGLLRGQDFEVVKAQIQNVSSLLRLSSDIIFSPYRREGFTQV